MINTYLDWIWAWETESAMEGEGEEKNRNLKIRKRKIKRIETAVATQAPSVTETSRRKNTLFIVESAETSQGFFFFFFLRFAKSIEPYGFQFQVIR